MVLPATDSVPTLVFSRLGCGLLLNADTREFEGFMEIEDFEICGWFLRKKIERPFTGVKMTGGLIETIYHLEWHGTRACRKVSAKFWAPAALSCPNNLCGENVYGDG